MHTTACFLTCSSHWRALRPYPGLSGPPLCLGVCSHLRAGWTGGSLLFLFGCKPSRGAYPTSHSFKGGHNTCEPESYPRLASWQPHSPNSWLTRLCAHQQCNIPPSSEHIFEAQYGCREQKTSLLLPNHDKVGPFSESLQGLTHKWKFLSPWVLGS